MRSHLKQASSCKWWPSHAKEAAAKLTAPPAPTIVRGSIHDMTTSFWDEQDDFVPADDEEEEEEEEDDE